MASSVKAGGQAPNGRRGPKTGTNVAARTIPAQLEPEAPAVVDAPAVVEASAPVDTPARVDAPAPVDASAPVDTPARIRSGAGTPHLNFDPRAAFHAYRGALAPTLRAQREALKAIECFGRYQYSVAGDYLEWGAAQAKANLKLGTPAELTASQAALATQFGAKIQGRVREFVNLASETRASLNQLLGEMTAGLAETIKQSVNKS
jgi:hypothetical protein